MQGRVGEHGAGVGGRVVWTKTADQILESIARYCTRINDSRRRVRRRRHRGDQDAAAGAAGETVGFTLHLFGSLWWVGVFALVGVW